jgi:3,4-dihydroxy 2-butanone 4-phosphate synthase/GTP cyclohydrolase II
MRLGEYLSERGIKKGDFAREIDVSAGWITALCDGTGWPSRDVAEKIARATSGEVTADDFLALEQPAEPAEARP